MVTRAALATHLRDACPRHPCANLAAGCAWMGTAAALLFKACATACKAAGFQIEAFENTFRKLAPLVLTQLEACRDDIIADVFASLLQSGEASVMLHRQAEEAKAASLQKQSADKLKAAIYDKMDAFDLAPPPPLSSPPLSPAPTSRAIAAPAAPRTHLNALDSTNFLARVAAALAGADEHLVVLMRPLHPGVTGANLSTSALFTTAAGGGTIYILSNPAFRSNITKIGLTTTATVTRSLGLYKTGVPQPFVVEHSRDVDSHVALYERVLHNFLRDLRHNEKREFFRISVADARKIVDIVCDVKVHE